MIPYFSYLKMFCPLERFHVYYGSRYILPRFLSLSFLIVVTNVSSKSKTMRRWSYLDNNVGQACINFLATTNIKFSID